MFANWHPFKLGSYSSPETEDRGTVFLHGLPPFQRDNSQVLGKALLAYKSGKRLLERITLQRNRKKEFLIPHFLK